MPDAVFVLSGTCNVGRIGCHAICLRSEELIFDLHHDLKEISGSLPNRFARSLASLAGDG
jgi:hypothetical protein